MNKLQKNKQIKLKIQKKKKPLGLQMRSRMSCKFKDWSCWIQRIQFKKKIMIRLKTTMPKNKKWYLKNMKVVVKKTTRKKSTHVATTLRNRARSNHSLQLQDILMSLHGTKISTFNRHLTRNRWSFTCMIKFWLDIAIIVLALR